MSKIDDLIQDTLTEEDERLLAEYGSEPGYLRQAFSLFRGPLGWVMSMVMACAIGFGLASIWCIYKAMVATEMLDAVQWAMWAVIGVQLTTFLRGFMGDHFEANRVLREIKRIELRLVRMESR